VPRPIDERRQFSSLDTSVARKRARSSEPEKAASDERAFLARRLIVAARNTFAQHVGIIAIYICACERKHNRRKRIDISAMLRAGRRRRRR